MLKMVFQAAAVAIIGAAGVASAQLPIPQNPGWEPIVDEVYLQEVSTLIKTDQPIAAIATFKGKVFAGDSTGVSQVDGESITRQSGMTSGVTRLKVLNDSLWAIASDGLWKSDGTAWTKVAEQPVADLCVHNGKLIAASGKELYAVEDAGLVAITKNSPSDLRGIASYSGTIYVHDGKRVGLLEKDQLVYENIFDWGTLPRGCTIRDMMADGSKLYLATDEGLGVLRGMTWYTIQGEDGLCYEDTTCLARGFNRDMWIGTMRGAIRNVDNQYQFFGHERWIPNDHVNAIASGDKTVYVATDGGLGIITYEPYTLAKKAAYYERWLDEWGMRRLGFIHILFNVDGKWIREVSDNDVGYSSHYVSAKCFEYAVTGDRDARAAAVEGMKTMKWSEEITSIDGFPARSIYAVGEVTHKAMHGSGGLPAEWHATPDGLWEWKGDTSSDETDAHAYETAIFLSLVANDEEKVWATEHLQRVMGHIVDNGFLLRDVDGKPTRWARWDPEYLQTPYGYYARGLNGMEAFNYVTTAYHFTKDEKFAKAKQFHLEQGYLPDIVRQKLTFHPGYWTHFDDRLAFYSYFTLIPFETDPDLKALWLRSIERSWEIKRNQSVPWFNFIYGAATGNECEVAPAVDHLRGWPLDLRRHSYTNSHRDDLHLAPGYREYGERPKALNPRETEPNRWDGDFTRLDGVYGGNMVSDPSGWLDAYWMGRYYGMITAPQTDDKDLLTVPKRGLKLGAEPYSGPPRQKLEHEQ